MPKIDLIFLTFLMLTISISPAISLASIHAIIVQGYKVGQGENLMIQSQDNVVSDEIVKEAAKRPSYCKQIEFANIQPHTTIVTYFNGTFNVIKTEAPWIPSDPGQIGKITIRGIDTDGDCIRDDLERLIVKLAPAKKQRKARKYLYEYARLRSRFLTSQESGFNSKSAKEYAKSIFIMRECIHKEFKNRSESETAIRKTFSKVHNTQARSISYFNNNKLLGGWSQRSDIAVSCN